MNNSKWVGNTSSTPATPESTLTVEKLKQMMRVIDSFPPRPAFDVAGHDLGPEIYEINDELQILPKNRRFLVVPRYRLFEIAETLERAGADVRVLPVQRSSEPEGES